MWKRYVEEMIAFLPVLLHLLLHLLPLLLLHIYRLLLLLLTSSLLILFPSQVLRKFQGRELQLYKGLKKKYRTAPCVLLLAPGAVKVRARQPVCLLELFTLPLL